MSFSLITALNLGGGGGGVTPGATTNAITVSDGPGGTTTAYPPLANTDAARATALRTAAAASTNKHLYVPAGTYAMGLFPLLLKAGSTVFFNPGVLITSSVDGAVDGGIVQPVGDGITLVMYGAEIRALGGVSSQYQFPLGCAEEIGNAAFTNFRCFGGLLTGMSDAFYIQHTTVCSAILRDVRMVSTWDACVAFSDTVTPTAHTVDCYDCIIDITGPFGSEIVDGILAQTGATVRWFGGSIRAVNGGATRNSCVFAETSAVVEVIGARLISTNSGAATPYDLNNNGGTIKTTGCYGSGTAGALLTHGTITEPAGPSPVITATNYTIGTNDPMELYGGMIYVTAAATITVPAVAFGANFSVLTIGAVAVSVDPNASDLIVRDGTAQADGEKITNTSTAGDLAVFNYYSSAGWYAATNAWTNGG